MLCLLSPNLIYANISALQFETSAVYIHIISVVRWLQLKIQSVPLISLCVSPLTLSLLSLGDDTMTGDGGEYLRPEDLRELGDDSLPGQYLDGMNYLRFSLEGGRTDRYSWHWRQSDYSSSLALVK